MQYPQFKKIPFHTTLVLREDPPIRRFDSTEQPRQRPGSSGHADSKPSTICRYTKQEGSTMDSVSFVRKCGWTLAATWETLAHSPFMERLLAAAGGDAAAGMWAAQLPFFARDVERHRRP